MADVRNRSFRRTGGCFLSSPRSPPLINVVVMGLGHRPLHESTQTMNSPPGFSRRGRFGSFPARIPEIPPVLGRGIDPRLSRFGRFRVPSAQPLSYSHRRYFPHVLRQDARGVRAIPPLPPEQRACALQGACRAPGQDLGAAGDYRSGAALG